MREKLKGMLTHNLGLKVLSLILAVFTWLIMVNVSNPLLTVTQTVPVEFTNADVLTRAGLTYESVGRNTVTVSYKTHVRDASRISANDFYAYADLAQLYDVTGSIPVQVDISTYTGRMLITSGSVTVTPAVVRIQTEPIQSKSFILTPHVSGEAADGYVIGEVKLSPVRITARGAESVIGQISSAGVEINVEDIDTDITGTETVNFYDANGNMLNLADSVELNVRQVSYSVSVLRSKDLTLDFQVSGTVVEGYRFTGVECDVRSVSVVGLRSALANLNTLTVSGDALNINRATRDVVVTVNLDDYLPDNISIAGGEEIIATITMRIEKLETRQFEISMDQVQVTGPDGDYQYAFWDSVLELQIRGLPEDLDMLKVSDIQVAVDLSGLEPDMHQVDLQVILEEGFDFVGPTSVRVQIDDAFSSSYGPGVSGETSSQDNTQED